VFPPSVENGSPVLSYSIEFKSNDGFYYPTADCVESLAQNPDTTFTCSVYFTSLRVSPFWLAFNDPVEVRISATNAIGTSRYSETNKEGSLVQT
jgi:hypothetical protein